MLFCIRPGGQGRTNSRIESAKKCQIHVNHNSRTNRDVPFFAHAIEFSIFRDLICPVSRFAEIRITANFYIRLQCGVAGAWRLMLSNGILFFVLLGNSPASAQDYDKFSMSAGGYAVFRYDSSISLTETNSGLGLSFRPEDTLGLESEQTVFRLDAQYRINPKHALTASWYRITSLGNKTLAEDIDWIDENGDTIVIPIGTAVASSLKYDIFKVGYLWSFYHNEKIELAVGAGLHLAKVAVGLDVQSNLLASELSTAQSNLPLPVLSFKLDYKVTPKFDWFLKSQSFALSLVEWRGTYTDIELGMTYQAFENFGVGVGLGSNALNVIRESDNVRFEFDNRVSGLHFFVSANF